MSKYQDADAVIDGLVSFIDPQNNSDAGSDVDGNSVDRQSYGMPQSVAILIQHNNAQAGDSFDYKLQESADNASWTDVDGGGFDTISSSPAHDVQVFDLTGVDRYIRVKLASADATLGGASVDIQATGAFVGGKESNSIT